MQKIALPFVACLLAIAAVDAHAQSVWKWRDASGQLHISDTAPPPGTPATNIVSGPMRATAPVASPKAATPGASAPDSDLDKKKKAADKDQADKEKADKAATDQKNAAIRADNCARATSAAAGIQSGVRLATTNAKGEREILDDTARAAELKHAQDIMAANCGAAPAAQ